MITRFQGESRRDAIVNHFCFDIVEEDEFFDFIEDLGYSEDDDDETLENLHKMFLTKTQ